MYLRAGVWLAVTALVAACSPTSRDAPAHVASNSPRDLHVLMSAGFAAAYDRLAPQFERAGEVRLITVRGPSTGGTPDSIPVRLERGERFDVVIMSRAQLDELTERGFLRPASRVDLARSLIGMAVQVGARVPDMSTPSAFVEALRAAESIGYSASVSGIYLSTELFPRLGLSDELAPKSRQVTGELVGAVVARGEVEIGFQQVSELITFEGVEYVGPIPADYQLVTTFTAAITSQASNPMDGQRLIEFLASVEAAAVVEAAGLERPQPDQESGTSAAG